MIAMAGTSNTVFNRSGDSGHPCLVISKTLAFLFLGIYPEQIVREHAQNYLKVALIAVPIQMETRSTAERPPTEERWVVTCPHDKL